ncbi:allophanate hydrolase [Paraburkholderia sp. MMS20-SJTN17]|uniref:Allophanate hydrolase n=1 Tax=Paraburkholderia translucens TaxID=2886945 RepID=A0ABS8KAC0_9BURK|nr:allophanate hydrolase [Paraburkholderia sp. MMS20-SJTN17]MCC8401429.1 allophanate hydrolase [Paraburkholderia sp. MMS20-SJTN17]
MNAAQPMTIAGLQAQYRDGTLTPAQLVDSIAARLAEGDPHHAWIRPLTRDEMMRYAEALEDRDPASLPLYGVPFAIKDNIDLAGIPTTAGCPDYAYVPQTSAPVVARLIAAGAIPVGKTNLDQFATGLSGQRSPYGACRNALDMRYASGGSSSGSAVSVALGIVAFSLGTDTAGSGRVPAAFHGLIGLKPTKGVLSTQGVVPACKSLDCVTIFAQTIGDARIVFDAARGVAEDDPYGRLWSPLAGAARPREARSLAGVRLGVPRAAQLEFFGDDSYRAAFDAALARAKAAGAHLVEIDFEPFLATARLLYEGPWVAERLAAIREFHAAKPEALHPVIREIIGGAARWSAADVFEAFDRLATLRLQSERVWSSIDAIFMPTSATTATVDELEADPIRVNSRFGYYTNFVNLLDLSALAVPAGQCTVGRHARLPFGITFVARAHEDAWLLDLAKAWLGNDETGAEAANPSDDLNGRTRVAVVGAHLTGQPLNWQLTQRNARLIRTTRTAQEYRLYALPAAPGAVGKPGLVRTAHDGVAIEVEVWEMPVCAYGSFVAGIAPPLGIGTLKLADGSLVQGFLCESAALAGAIDISDAGGWRSWVGGCSETADVGP